MTYPGAFWSDPAIAKRKANGNGRRTARQWAECVRAALRDREAFAELVQPLTGPLRGAAWTMARPDHDDALQAAMLAIWRALPKVRLTNPYTIRNMLWRTGIRAILDTIRNRRRRLHEPMLDSNEPAARRIIEQYDLPPLLELYKEYVIQNGSLAGAHKHFGDLLGIGARQASTLFNQEAETWAASEGLRHEGRQRAIERIIERVKAHA